MPPPKTYTELVQRENGLWAILTRTGSEASVIETGHLDRRLAARDLASWRKYGRLSRIGQAWIKAADKLRGNVATRKFMRGGDRVSREDILRILLAQDYRCPVTHRQLDPRLRPGPWQPSVDRIDIACGYAKENIRIVAYIANVAMNVWGEEPLVDMAHRIVARGLRPEAPVAQPRLKFTTPATPSKRLRKRTPQRRKLLDAPISHNTRDERVGRHGFVGG